MASILEVLKMVPTICEEYGYDEPQVITSSTMTKALGRCWANKKLIKLNEQFIERNDIEVVTDLLKHEIAHLKFKGHGADFMKECKRMGIKHHTHLEHPDADFVVGIYTYECPVCRKQYGTSKKYKNKKSCGECSPGRYDEQFKLRLIS